MSFNKKILGSIGLIIIFATVGWFGRVTYTKTHPKVGVISTILPPGVNFGSSEQAIGAADNLFVGTVIKQVSAIPHERKPRTQFSVNVIYNIKGNLQDETIINQIGGYLNGVLYVITEGDNPEDYLLSPGSTYLFATRGNNTLVFWPFSATLLTSEQLSKEEMMKLIKSNSRISDLQMAYPEEVLMDADVIAKRTPNAFKDLPPAEQEKIKAEVEQMKTETAQTKTPEPSTEITIPQEITPTE
jgi:hypothetical protein